jgi:hypothetical protein
MATMKKSPFGKPSAMGKKAMGGKSLMGAEMPKTMKAFEKSPMDKEPKGMKEGSKADKALDKKQFAKAKAKK